MRSLSSFFLLLFLCPAGTAFAQPSAVTLSGQIRHRSELDARTGQDAGGAIPFHLLRTRLGATFIPAATVRAFVEVQDARLFGDNDPDEGRGTTDGSAAGLDVHQAYFDVRTSAEGALRVRVGRQVLAYGNQRLVGRSDWGRIGRSFDAGVVSYEAEPVRVDLFSARLVGRDDSRAGQNLHGAFVTGQIAEPLAFDVFGFRDTRSEAAEGNAVRTELARHTAGARLHGAFGRLDYDAEAAYQGGSAAGSTPSRIRASLASVEAGYTVLAGPELRIGLLFTRLSGDRDSTDRYDGQFNTLFGSNHGRYGQMDYFPGVAPEAGLRDFAVLASVNATQALQLEAEFHHFVADAPAHAAAALPTDYGRELDASLTFKANRSLSVGAGAAAFWPGGLMRALHGEDPTYWAFLMTTVVF